MDTEVVILITLTLILLSLLLAIHSIVTNKYKSVPTKNVAKKMTQETLENVWEHASLLCAEPIPAVLPHITCRLLASSWLIGVTFILFFLGCYLRTDFSTESYNFIDSLSDLIKSGIKPTFMSPVDLRYIKNWVNSLSRVKSSIIQPDEIGLYQAAQDPVVKDWLDAFDEKKLVDFFRGIDSYLPILSGEKALIINTELMIHTLEYDYRGSKNLVMSKDGFYFSQQFLKLDYKHYIFNTSWIRSIPQLNAQLMVEPMFEKKIFKNQEPRLRDIIEQFKWKRPSQSTEALDLSSVSVPFNLLLTLLSITVAVVITEIIFN